ncbi:MAG: hypothetical protein ACU85V_20075 [Gammaproteobacteria bacterium]
MSTGLIRTLQVGVALIVVTIVTVLTLVILGVMSQEAALRIGLDVSGIIALAVGAGIVLSLVFGIGGGAEK